MRALLACPFDAGQLRRLCAVMAVEAHPEVPARRLRLTAEEVRAAAVAYDGLIVELTEVGAAAFAPGCRLRWLACCRHNPVNVDVAAATAAGIPVFIAPGRNAVAVAELTVALMLMLARRVIPARDALLAGEWRAGSPSPYSRFQGLELSGARIGLVGLGHVGTAVARRLAGFEVRLQAHDPFVPAETAASVGAELVDLDTVFATSDLISIHCKATPETRNLVNRRVLGLVRPGTYLINTARASIVDEAALVEALTAGRLAGAALDVHWREPPPADAPYLRLPNVIVTPHIGGATTGVVQQHSRLIVDALLAYLQGERPRHVANAEVLAREPPR